MKQISKRLTYANVMSSIAVFLVLGGATAFAAKKISGSEIKGNSIGTGKLKKNAVTTSKIKKNAITTAKIKNGAVTGAKVDVSTLATVPSATHATTADTATNWNRYFTTGVVKTSAGQNVTLFSIGPFNAVGQCKDLGGGTLQARTILTTSQAGSSASARLSYYGNADFNPGAELQLGSLVENNSPEIGEYGESDNSYFTAESADGKTLLTGEVRNAVYYFGAQCAFIANGTNNG